MFIKSPFKCNKKAYKDVKWQETERFDLRINMSLLSAQSKSQFMYLIFILCYKDF